MTPGLNLARASCAAESREGSMASSVRSNRQAASREIGFAPAFANSAIVAASASGKKVAIRLYFETRFIRTRRKSCGALATIITDRANPCPVVAYRHAFKTRARRVPYEPYRERFPQGDGLFRNRSHAPHRRSGWR